MTTTGFDRFGGDAITREVVSTADGRVGGARIGSQAIDRLDGEAARR